MATRDEKDALEQMQRDLAALSESIVDQAYAVTDKVTRARLMNRAGQVLGISVRIGDLID